MTSLITNREIISQNTNFLYPCVQLKRILSLCVSICFIWATNTLANDLANDKQNTNSLSVLESDNTYTNSDLFIKLLVSDDHSEVEEYLKQIKKRWNASLTPFVLELLPHTSSIALRLELLILLKNESGKDYGFDTNRWYEWLWNTNIKAASSYDDFKARLYRTIDPKFEKYFVNRQTNAKIRLDEVRWGGVVQDGIPPLRNPKMLSAKKARYLDDDNIIFGIKINGDARAYPKRILAWHEMFTDTIGGVDIAGVYCTLCGTVIPYRTSFDNNNYQLGTSGFLYRSNKLMYDKKTQSLWSTELGEPVIGPLVGKNIRLPFESVVTTTWGEWRQRHPDTTVLSLNTGHRRDYNEGAAYANYFATDELMFNTPFNDKRLANKQEVLALRFPGAPNEQLAIDTDFLNKNPVYHNAIAKQNFVVFTDSSGANRVYDSKSVSFVSYDQQLIAKDNNGGQWQVEEENLIGPNKQKLPRLPYHRAFWFGWHAAFPETRLIK